MTILSYKLYISSSYEGGRLPIIPYLFFLLWSPYFGLHTTCPPVYPVVVLQCSTERFLSTAVWASRSHERILKKRVSYTAAGDHGNEGDGISQWVVEDEIGHKFSVKLDPLKMNWTSVVKKQLQGEYTSLRQQRLIYFGKTLEDRSLREYGTMGGDTLHLIVHPYLVGCWFWLEENLSASCW